MRTDKFQCNTIKAAGEKLLRRGRIEQGQWTTIPRQDQVCVQFSVFSLKKLVTVTFIQWRSKFQTDERTTVVPASSLCCRPWRSWVAGVSCWPGADVLGLRWGLKLKGGNWGRSQEGFPWCHLAGETMTFVSKICRNSAGKRKLYVCVRWGQLCPKAKGLSWWCWRGLSVIPCDAVAPALGWEGPGGLPASAFLWHLLFFHSRISEHFRSGQTIWWSLRCMWGNSSMLGYTYQGCTGNK